MTVSELKVIINDLPDDMEIEVYNGRDKVCNIEAHWIMSKDLDLEYEDPDKLILSID